MKKLKHTISICFVVSIPFFYYGCMEPIFSDTENGDQVGSAIVNNIAWETDWYAGIGVGLNRALYFTNYSTGDSTTLNLDGRFIEGPEQDRTLNFVIVLKNVPIKKFEDIKALNGQIFMLDGINNYAAIKNLFSEYEASNGTGTIKIENVKTVKGITWVRSNGERYHPLIIEGTFEFDFSSANIKVESGMFNFQIHDSYLDQK